MGTQHVPPPATESAEAPPDEMLDATGDDDLSSISTLSKLSSNASKLTDIDGQSGLSSHSLRLLWWLYFFRCI